MSNITRTTATPAFLSMAPSAPLAPILEPRGDYVMRGVPKFNKLADETYKIVVILDESGSMNSVRKDIIKAVNNLIDEQREIRDTGTISTALFTLVKFSDKITTVKLNAPFASTELLTTADYIPDGATALYDAIGETIDAYKREKNVLMVIVTDGAENSSKIYNKSSISEAIEKFKADESLCWSFVYIGCDAATMRQGGNLGLATGTKAAMLQTAGRDKFIGCMSKVSNAIQSQRITTAGQRAYGYSKLTQELQSTPEAAESQQSMRTSPWYTHNSSFGVYGEGL